MLREKLKRQHKVSKRTRYPVNITSTAIHVSIRRYGNRFYIKRLLWCQFLPELTWYALPLNFLDSTSQEQWKGFINQMNVIEFDPISITNDKKSQDYLRQNFLVIPNEEKYELTQTNTKYRTWSTIINDGENTTETDDSTTENF